MSIIPYNFILISRDIYLKTDKAYYVIAIKFYCFTFNSFILLFHTLFHFIILYLNLLIVLNFNSGLYVLVIYFVFYF